MLKKMSVLCTVFCTATILFAYNPPAGGENMYALTSPVLLSGGISAAGGPFMQASSESVIINPALTGGVQRFSFDVAGTWLNSFGYAPIGNGGAFNLGAVIPTRWGVFTGSAQGVFSDFNAMPLGNTITLRAGFAKDILDVFYFGAAIDGAFGTSWALNLNIGVWHRIGKLGFMNDFRWGASLTGMGKPLHGRGVGINGYRSDWYPSYLTLRVGAAATLVSLEKFKIGAAIDLSFPTFQNLVADFAIAFKIFDFFSINSGWTVNTRELINGKYSLVPSVGISFVFGVSGKKDSFLDKQGWQKSEITPHLAYRQLYSGINAVSAGASVSLGAQDMDAPVIQLGGSK